jgi:hypothetical protein
MNIKQCQMSKLKVQMKSKAQIAMTNKGTTKEE